jgi:glycerol-3-phosphate acyltransferase PlsY
VLDVAKGTAAVLLARLLFGGDGLTEWAGAVAGVAPIVTAMLVGVGAASVPALAFALASGLLVTISHADNIGRLRAGTERRIGQKEQVGSRG